jgi:CRISPR-associated protein Cst2
MVGRTREETADEKASEETQERQVTAQMIYHRPTRSGVYALISAFQPWRIGLNEVDYTYVIKDEDRNIRYQLALSAYKAAFIRTEGAMTSTRLPHIEAIEGVVVTSESNFPVPVISPLRDTFIIDIENLTKCHEGLSYQRFKNLKELCDILIELEKEKIHKLLIPKV